MYGTNIPDSVSFVDYNSFHCWGLAIKADKGCHGLVHKGFTQSVSSDEIYITGGVYLIMQ